MDIHTHERINQIKKLSRLLFKLLTIFKYLLYLGWPAIAVIALYFDKGTLTLGGKDLLIEELAPWLKLFVLCLYAAGLTLAIRITTNFRDLMKHFMEGDVFRLQAIGKVRAALTNGIFFCALAVTQETLGWILTIANGSTFNPSLGTDIFIAILFFGLMYTLLWTLEIGCDLYEESEMTI